LGRAGHTEANVDLMRLAHLPPYGVLCELMNVDGSMARLPEAYEFAECHGYPMVTVRDICDYRKNTSR